MHGDGSAIRGMTTAGSFKDLSAKVSVPLCLNVFIGLKLSLCKKAGVKRVTLHEAKIAGIDILARAWLLSSNRIHLIQKCSGGLDGLKGQHNENDGWIDFRRGVAGWRRRCTRRLKALNACEGCDLSGAMQPSKGQSSKGKPS